MAMDMLVTLSVTQRVTLTPGRQTVRKRCSSQRAGNKMAPPVTHHLPTSGAAIAKHDHRHRWAKVGPPQQQQLAPGRCSLVKAMHPIIRMILLHTNGQMPKEVIEELRSPANTTADSSSGTPAAAAEAPQPSNSSVTPALKANGGMDG